MQRIGLDNIPEGMEGRLMRIEEFIKRSSLSKSTLELVRLRVSQINGCAYCVDMHHKELKHLKESDLRLSSLCVWEETNYFSEKEAVVLKFAEEVTALPKRSIPDEVFEPLTTFFTKEEICYLTLAIAQINTWNRLMMTFRFVPGKYKVKI